MHSYRVPFYLCTRLIDEASDIVQHLLFIISVILNSTLLSMEVNPTHICKNCIAQMLYYHHRRVKMMKLITPVMRCRDEYKHQEMRVITLTVLLAYTSTGKLTLKVECSLLDGEAVNEKDYQMQRGSGL